MNVIEHKPGAWFLLKNGEDLYIDVNCGHGFVSFSIAVKLSEIEKKYYREQGVGFLVNLSNVIAEKSEYNHPRNVKNKDVLTSIEASILRFNQQKLL